MEQAFSPLDEELALLPGSVTPSLVESMVRLGTWMPFKAAAKMLSYFTKVDISEVTVRRNTESAGQAYVEIQTSQVETLQRELPGAIEGPAVQQVSVDGAMVPLVHKQWAEVKTLAIGTVQEPVLKKGEWEIHTEELSYFSRLADHETFARLATVETHRRGTETAGLVCAVMDGAEWEQKFIDLHCPNAVRILDFAHAAEYVAKVAQAVFGAGTAETSEWLGVQLHELKHGDSQAVLTRLRGLRDELAAQVEGGQGDSEALEVVSCSLEYLEKRQEQIHYREFLAAGYPIGSGAVESANKLVVEARMKGAGMHWARGNVNPMVALRTIACSDRWDEAWIEISERLRQWTKERAESFRRKDRAEQRGAKASIKVIVLPLKEPDEKDVAPVVQSPAIVTGSKAEPTPAKGDEKPTGPRRPAANHPWRHMPIGRARFARSTAQVTAET